MMRKYAIAMTVAFVAVFGGMFLFGCQDGGTTPEKIAVTLANVCKTAATSLRVATALDRAGKLSASERRTISTAVAAINAPCSQTKPPTDLQAALVVVSQASVNIAVIVAAKGGQ